MCFSSYCVIERMHVHASDRRSTEVASAKLFVKQSGNTIVQSVGVLSDRGLHKIQKLIKPYDQEMYLKWSAYSKQGFYGDIK